MTLYSLCELATGWTHLEIEGVRSNPTNGHEISNGEYVQYMYYTGLATALPIFV